jgi:hypothetical protein
MFRCRALARRRGALEFLPLLAGDPGLSQDAGKEFATYIRLVWIRQNHGDVPLVHELVPAT